MIGSFTGPLLLICIALFAFASSAEGYFVCDDLLHMHYLWRAFNGEPGLLAAPFYSPWLKDVSFYNFYRPLTELSFALDYWLYQTHAAAWHIMSLLWHVVNVLLLYSLCKNLLELPAFYLAGARERTITAFFSAALWAAYPTHVEAVSWIAARSDLLATFFYLLTMQLFILELRGKIKVTKLWALPMVLGCLCKELIISLPFVLFALSWLINTESRKRNPAQNAFKKSLAQTLPAFIILALYTIGRALAIGDLIGGYAGSTGIALNNSLVNRWFYTQSLFKVFHPFNDQLIGENNPLRMTLRIIWGICGVMTLASARLGGAIATKYRLILFAFAWLFLTLLPNLQVWNFSSTMAGGRIAYLPTIPISFLIVFSVYPIGVSALANNLGSWVKLVAIITLSALTIVLTAITRVNNVAWLAASRTTHQIAEQLADIVQSNLPPGKRLVVLNLPAHINGAFAFTNPGMAQIFLQQPFCDDDDSKKLTVLDDQPCSYPHVNSDDVKASAIRADLYQFYCWDPELKQLQSLAQKNFEDRNFNREKFSATRTATTGANTKNLPEIRTVSHNFEVEGENFVLAAAPQINPPDCEFLELTLVTSPDAQYDGSAATGKKEGTICYLWNNCPPDGDGERQVFSVQTIKMQPAPGTTKYLIDLGENKLWLLSHDVSQLQVYFPYLKDAKSVLNARLLAGPDVAPIIKATVSGESEADSLLSLKKLAGSQILSLDVDARALGATETIVELMPPYHYFAHYEHKLSAVQFNEKHLKTFVLPGSAGILRLGQNDFPSAGTYQMRVCAVNNDGEITSEFSQPITVNVSKVEKDQVNTGH